MVYYFLPFRMDRLLQEGKMTQEQVNKYMEMLCSNDEELENLAVTQLQFIVYGRTWTSF